ncbi:NADH dehydrogenase [ubiquinone] 1 alpha subcomplex assembly factor 2 [Rhodnius prolixus]|uniref:Uncharacterized protein n=2 Tax=Rhodnius TaxID=13248 RepID=R4G416_RHOPR
MSRDGRGLIVSIFKDFVNSLKPRQSKGNFVGKDNYGNQYFETPSNHRRFTRYYVPKGGDVTKFDEGLPAEWESWLRHRRKTPPTEEEVAQNLAMLKMRREQALKIEEKFKSKKLDEKNSTRTSTSFPQYVDFELYPGKKSEEKT